MAINFLTGQSIDGNLSVLGGSITLGGISGRIQGIVTVLSGTDATSKTYVDNAITNTTGNYLPLSAGSSYPLTGGLHIPHYIYHASNTGTVIGYPSDNRFLIGTDSVTRVDVTNAGLSLGDHQTNVSVSTILDEDDMASDSATALATQQSVKAYVDAQTPGAGPFLPLSGGTLTGPLAGTTATFSSNITSGSTTKTTSNVVRSLAADTVTAGFEAYGASQGTGYAYVGQSSSHGGGMFYNGDGTPAFATGETADRVSFYRRAANANTVVFEYPYNSSTVTFKGPIVVGGTITGQNIYGNQFVDAQDNAYYANPAGTSVMKGADFDGDVTVTTQAVGNNSTLVATTAYADAAAAAVPIGNYVTLTTAQTISGVKTFSTYIGMQENHLINYVFQMIENASPQYILLCRNAANNDINGVIRMDRTSGNWQASSIEVIVSSGSTAMYGGTLRTLQVLQSSEDYRLISCTYNSESWIAIKYTGNTYPETTGAYFTGRAITSTGTPFTVVSSGITNEAAFGGTTESYNEVGSFVISGDLTVSGGDITLGGTGRIQGVDTVTDSTDAANKAYVDAKSVGILTLASANGITVTGGTTANATVGVNYTAASNNLVHPATTITDLAQGTSYGTYFLCANSNPGITYGAVSKIRTGHMRLNDFGSPDGSVSMNSQKITNVATPTATTDAANKAYVDAHPAGTVTGTGVASRVAFWSGTSSLSSDVNLYWDGTNDRLGIGTTSPEAKLDINGHFCVDSKTHTITDAFTTCLTVNLTNHTGCHVVITAFGDWPGHSSAAYRGEFFLQNGANAYAEPGIILRQDDNTSTGTDQIICQIVDPTSTANPKDFAIQIRHTDTTSPASWTAQLTYTVQGKFNSIT